MAEPNRLVCFRVAEACLVVSDSVKESCDQCYAPVWISPTSQRMIARATRRPEIVCVPCYDAGEKNEIVLMPGQLAEIARICGPEIAMDVAKAFQRPGTN